MYTEHASRKFGGRLLGAPDNTLRGNPDVLFACQTQLGRRFQNGSRFLAGAVQKDDPHFRAHHHLELAERGRIRDADEERR